MTPQMLELIHADIMTAKQILYPDSSMENALRNPYMINNAAYHSIQAIEKTLKAILQTHGKMNADLYTHNISALLIEVELVEPDFIKNHTFIAQNANALTEGNALRYGRRSISPSNAKGLYHVARELYREVCGKYMEETGKSAKEIQQDNWDGYKTQDFISLTFPDREENGRRKTGGHEDFE